MTTRRTTFAVLLALVSVAVWLYAGWVTFHPPTPFVLLQVAAGVAACVAFLYLPFWPALVFLVVCNVVFGVLADDHGGSFYYGTVALLFVSPLWYFGRGLYRASRKSAQGDRRIIGLSGYAGAGKDTAAAGLLEDGWTRVAVSDKIAELALRIDPLIDIFNCEEHDCDCLGSRTVIDREYLSVLVEEEGWTSTKEYRSVRELLQNLGKGVRDIIDPEAWVTATMRDLPDGDLVFTSVRFPNEANALTKVGGKIVRIERPGLGPVNGHETETAMDGWNFDHVLVNDAEPRDAADAMRSIAAGL